MHYTYRTAGLDWLDIWRRMYDAERAQGERATAPGFQVGEDFWAGQAERFAAAARRAPQPDAFMQRVLPQLRPDDIVLDIGAGSGRYLPVLARACAHVIALEPSPAMRAHLERRIAEERLENVTVVAATWPAQDVPPCDVAISAHVVYGVREIGPFLERMRDVARRECFLYLALRHPSTFISPLWRRFHGEERLPLPGGLECLCVLHQLGIPAGLELIPVGSRITFAGEDEALADVRFRLRLPPDPARDTAIRAAIRELFEPAADGQLAPPDQPRHAALIRWGRDETSGAARA
ncbi:MAG TPA: class I SAM-dependent methyltransferase [Roseiflexaceae bacterium]|nr:class I SAM-dependent methyltransferase [Roseiflexaceae bacterium]